MYWYKKPHLPSPGKERNENKLTTEAQRTPRKTEGRKDSGKKIKNKR
jgi:hypothetical protein